jgi:hypothetical protein
MEEEQIITPVEPTEIAPIEEVSEVPQLFVGNRLVSEVIATEGADHFTILFADGIKETYHNDYKELILTDKMIGVYELKLRKANVVTKPLLELLSKYDYPVDDLQHMIKVLTEVLNANQERCYTKLFGRSPQEVSMKDFERILS